MNAKHFAEHLMKALAAIKSCDVNELNLAIEAEPELLTIKDLMNDALRSSHGGATKVLDALVAKGMTPVGFRDQFDNGPLLICHSRNVDWVVAQGVDPRSEPLVLADTCRLARMGDQERVEKVRALMRYDVDVNCRTHKNHTALSILTHIDGSLDAQIMVDLAQRLIDAGADLHVRFKDGASILLNAAGNNNMPVVSMLLEAGAQCDPDSGQAEWIASKAIRGDEPRTLRVLAERGLDLRTLKTEDENIGVMESCFVHDAVSVMTMLLDTKVYALDEVTSVPGKNTSCASVLNSYRARHAAQSAVDEIDFRPGSPSI